MKSQSQWKRPKDRELLETDNSTVLRIWTRCQVHSSVDSVLNYGLPSHTLLLLNAVYDIMFSFWQEKDDQLTFTTATQTENPL